MRLRIEEMTGGRLRFLACICNGRLFGGSVTPGVLVEMSRGWSGEERYLICAFPDAVFIHR